MALPNPEGYMFRQACSFYSFTLDREEFHWNYKTFLRKYTKEKRAFNQFMVCFVDYFDRLYSKVFLLNYSSYIKSAIEKLSNLINY